MEFTSNIGWLETLIVFWALVMNKIVEEDAARGTTIPKFFGILPLWILGVAAILTFTDLTYIAVFATLLWFLVAFEAIYDKRRN